MSAIKKELEKIQEALASKGFDYDIQDIQEMIEEERDYITGQEGEVQFHYDKDGLNHIEYVPYHEGETIYTKGGNND